MALRHGADGYPQPCPPELWATSKATLCRCRRLRANVSDEPSAATLMPAIDRVLHAERCVPGGRKATFDAPLVELPRGVMFEHEDVAYLVAAAGYLPWSFDGYGEPKVMDAATVVKVLTPRSIVRAFSAGYTPIVHQSACE